MQRVPRLTWNKTTAEKLDVHQISIDLAFEVARNRPELFDQPRATVPRPDGSLYDQPERLRMIGPDRAGRLITFILERPNQAGRSHIVTGWYASDRDERNYRRRRRIRK